VPFTPSHAVVALPFVRTPLVPAAIAVGAMTPDLPLFVRAVVPPYALTHRFDWLPLTVLMALGLLLIWRCVLRPSVRELSPVWIAARLPGEWDRGATAAARETFALDRDRRSRRIGGMLLLLISLTLGVVSHIVWDLFTHEDRWGTRILPALAQQWGPVPGFTWVQHGSSAIGLLILLVWGVRWLRARSAEPVERIVPRAVRVVWWASLPAILAAAWGIGLLTFGPIDADWTVAHLGYRVLPPACATWAVLTLGVAVAVAVRRAISRHGGTGASSASDG
jgi:hypothetical protein